MYQIILIARVVDGTANALRHLLYVILIFCRGTQKITSFGVNCLDIPATRFHNTESYSTEKS